VKERRVLYLASLLNIYRAATRNKVKPSELFHCGRNHVADHSGRCFFGKQTLPARLSSAAEQLSGYFPCWKWHPNCLTEQPLGLFFWDKKIESSTCKKSHWSKLSFGDGASIDLLTGFVIKFL
jgi:hypothetical protein